MNRKPHQETIFLLFFFLYTVFFQDVTDHDSPELPIFITFLLYFLIFSFLRLYIFVALFLFISYLFILSLPFLPSICIQILSLFSIFCECQVPQAFFPHHMTSEFQLFIILSVSILFVSIHPLKITITHMFDTWRILLFSFV